MIKLTFPIYYTQEFKKKKDKTFLVGLNWYRNVNHHTSNEVKKPYHDLVAEQLGDNKFDKVLITYHIFAKRNGTDGHNIRAVMEKFICDGLVVCGALKDDSINYLLGDESVYRIDSEDPRIEVFIEEYKDYE